MILQVDNYELGMKSAEFARTSREDAGLSQQFVAQNLGITRVTYQKIETGERFFTPPEVLKFCSMVRKSPNSYSNILFTPNGWDFTEKTDDEIREQLMETVGAAPVHTIKLLIDIFTREWGGNPLQLVELAAAHTYTNILQRLTRSENVVHDVKLCQMQAERKGESLYPDGVEPVRIEDLAKTNKVARDAYLDGDDGYVL